MLIFALLIVSITIFTACASNSSISDNRDMQSSITEMEESDTSGDENINDNYAVIKVMIVCDDETDYLEYVDTILSQIDFG